MDENFVYRYMQLLTRINNVNRQLFDIDLPRAEWYFLHLIKSTENEEAKLSDLADQENLTIQGLSRTARHLTKNGLIERRADPNDKRSTIMALTQKGKDTYAQANKQLKENLINQLESVDKDQLEAFLLAGEALLEVGLNNTRERND